MSKQQIGVVGMAVMGRNLALNIESRGYTVSIFNRSREKTEEVIVQCFEKYGRANFGVQHMGS